LSGMSGIEGADCSGCQVCVWFSQIYIDQIAREQGWTDPAAGTFLDGVRAALSARYPGASVAVEAHPTQEHWFEEQVTAPRCDGTARLLISDLHAHIRRIVLAVMMRLAAQ